MSPNLLLSILIVLVLHSPGPGGVDVKPIGVEQMGLTMSVPARATVERVPMAQAMTLSIVDSNQPPVWWVRVQSLIPSSPGATPRGLAEEHLVQLRTAEPKARVLVNQAMRFGPNDGWSLYVRHNSTGQDSVSGWVILPVGDETFMVFAVLVLGESFDAVHPLLDHSFSTVRLRSPTEINRARQARMDAGNAFLQSLTPDRLRAAADVGQFLRVYQPGSGGNREVGYCLVQAREGKRGELNPDRAAKDYDVSEQASGLLVNVQARLVLDVDAGAYADSLQVYWLAWDRTEEAWSIRATRRQGDAEVTEAETGLRSAPTPTQPTGELHVIRNDSQTRRRDPYQWSVPDVYLSQAEHWVLSRLLSRSPTGELELGYYWYQSSRRELGQRVDRWQPVTDGTARWRLISRLRPDDDETVTLFDQDGQMLRQTRPDGAVMVPSSPDEIRQLWQSQGLKWGGSK